MISCHPHIIRRPNDFDEHNPSKHFIRSLAFDHRFSKLSQVNVFDRVTRYFGAQRGGSLGQAEIGRALHPKPPLRFENAAQMKAALSDTKKVMLPTKLEFITP